MPYLSAKNKGKTMRLIISNAFSLSMLDRDKQQSAIQKPGTEKLRYPQPVQGPRDFLDIFTQEDIEVISAVGHSNTASIFSEILNYPVLENRTSIKLDNSTVLLVGQYVGPRLPESATSLPPGARIDWWSV